METFFDWLADINGVVNDFVWVKIGLIFLIGSGIIMTCCTKCFQVSRIGHWWKHTVGSFLKKNDVAKQKGDGKSITQFQALCTALAATVGTGNIAGVSAAIVIGGPGAVFWMWIAAFLGMMTKFSEIVLGLYFRRRNKNGEWSGGAMYYLKDGLGSIKHCKTLGAVLAVLFAIFTILASFGIGNMGQVNKITLNLEAAFFKNVDLGQIGGVSVLSAIIGFALMIVTGLIVLGGLQRIAAVAERVVPFMAIFYIIGALVLFILNIENVGSMFASIFRFAFGIEAMAGGVAGVAISQVITQGCKRGVFSNEAGLGSAVMVHASADVKEPVKQGMWGIFEVFADTFVICSMTAIVVLSSGYINLETGLPVDPNINDATLVSQAFGKSFGIVGEIFVAIAILLFAFTTILGWSQYGAKAVEYLFGAKAVKVYQVIFVVMIISGSVMTSSLAWDISDTFNGLMMIPNLIGVVALSPLVVKLTSNYIARHIKGEKIAPILSYDASVQEEVEN